MKLKSFSIENYLGLTKEVTFNLDDGLTAVVGGAGQGLNSLISGLSIFFGYQWPRREDFPQGSEATSATPVMTFTAVFSRVPDNLTPDRKTFFRPAAEYLLNERGELKISRAFRLSREGLQERVYATAIHPGEPGLNDLLQVNNSILKRRLTNSTVSACAVDRRCNSSIRHALWEHTAELSLNESEVSLCRGDALLIWQALQMHFPLMRIIRGQGTEPDEPPPAVSSRSPHENLVRVAPRHYTSHRVQDFSILEPTEMYDLPPTQQWVIIPQQIINRTEPPLTIPADTFLAQENVIAPGQETTSHLFCIQQPEDFSDEKVRQTWLDRIRQITEKGNHSMVILVLNLPSKLSGLPTESVRVLSRNKNGQLECLDERPLTEQAGIPNFEVQTKARGIGS